MKPKPATKAIPAAPQTNAWLVVGAIAGFVFPLAGWLLAMLTDQHKAFTVDVGIVPTPFGDLRLLVATLAGTLPISWYVARSLDVPQKWAIWLVIAALVLSVWPARLPPAAVVGVGTAEPLAALVGMQLWRVALTAPAQVLWLLAARGLAKVSPAPWAMAPGVVWLLVALVPLGCYAQKRAFALEREANEFYQQQRLLLAWQRLEAARAIRGTDVNQNARDVRTQLTQDMLQLARQVTAAREDDRSPAMIKALLQLNEIGAAKERLAASASTEKWRYELEIAITQYQGDWQEGERLILAQLARYPEGDHQREYNALVRAYLGQNRWQEAEELQRGRLAAAETDDERAHWHFQLAEHNKLIGHPHLAREHAQAAATLSNAATPAGQERIARATAVIDQLLRETPACLFASGDSQTLRK